MLKFMVTICFGLILMIQTIAFADKTRAETKSKHAAVAGCFELLQTEFEDGASYYEFIGTRIISPLQEDPKYSALAKFLDSALVIEGYMTINEDLCKSIEAAATP